MADPSRPDPPPPAPQAPERPALLVGGPLDGQWRQVRGAPERLYFPMPPISPSVSLRLGERPQAAPTLVRYVYRLDLKQRLADGWFYEYEGVST